MYSMNESTDGALEGTTYRPKEGNIEGVNEKTVDGLD